jgi:ribosomal protein S27E
MSKKKSNNIEEVGREFIYKSISDVIEIICESCKDKFSTIFSKHNEEVACPNCGHKNKTKK